MQAKIVFRIIIIITRTMIISHDYVVTQYIITVVQRHAVRSIEISKLSVGVSMSFHVVL